MPILLHILTKPDDALAARIIREQQKDPAQEVQTVELGVGNPDYKDLLEKIFAADSVQVW